MKKSRSYSKTLLFPIQEAVDSSASLNHLMSKTEPVKDHHHDKLVYLLSNYHKSEAEYLTELKIFENIVLNFDPVYNNYFDGSLDDITNEMVSYRKEKNDQLLNLVQSMIVKHTDLLQILSSTSDFDALLSQLSTWGKNITPLYESYLKYYKLDVMQAKSEIKIRRRPLIRVRYLNTFFNNLKNILITMDERPNSGEIISSFEVLTFKLTKCLDDCRSLDESEKKRCDSLINFSNAKDIISLKHVGVSVNQQDLQNSTPYISDLHYLNINESASLNFMKLEIFVTSNRYISIVQKDSFGKTLLFTPLERSEFQLHKRNVQDNITSLLFNHTLHSSKIQLCFAINSDNTDLITILTDFFPKVEEKISHAPLSIGLGIMIQSKNTAPSTPPQSEYTFEPTEELNIPTQPLHKLPSISSSNSYVLKTYLDRSKSQNSNLVHIPNSNIDAKNKRDIYAEILQKTADNEDSDDEDVDLPIIAHVPTPKESVSIPPPTEVKEWKTMPPTLSKKPTLDLSKYQNSITLSESETSSQPKRKKSIFGSFTNLLSKKKSSSKVTTQTVYIPETNSKKTREVSPTKSEHSISSVVTSNNDEISKIISHPSSVSKNISSAKLSLWRSHSWTKTRETNLVLHCLNSKTYYLGFYNALSKSSSDKTISSLDQATGTDKPILLIKINENTDCTFNTIDIHVTTESYKGNSLTLMIRPVDRKDMRIISNVLVNPEIVDSLLINNSYDSEISVQSQGTLLPKMDSYSSIESEISEVVKQTVVEPVKSFTTKSWTSVASLMVIENGKRVDLNRCVVSVEKREEDLINIDLVGFEFGNVELNVKKENIKEQAGREILVSKTGDITNDYILSFDSSTDLNLFQECVY